MRKGLYCMFGRIGDHNLNIPGHPLYHLYFLKSLSKKFNIDKFDIYYYDTYPFSFEDDIVTKFVDRTYLKHQLIDQSVSLTTALDRDYDHVFLKYRFLNKSRLLQGSLDRKKFDTLYTKHTKTNHDVWVIDTDGMIKEEYNQVLSLYANPKYKYPGNPKVERICPVLKEDILNGLSKELVEPNLTFIGNEYFKVGLNQMLEKIHDETGINIITQGSWNKHNYIDHIVDRTDRVKGYRYLSNSACTLQISKLDYKNYDFLSPRIFESYILGTIIFGQNSFTPRFSSFTGAVDLCEKIKFVSDLDVNEYLNILKQEVDECYDLIDKRLNNE